MRKQIAIVLAVGLLACSPAGLAYAQALPNINSLSVRYNSIKTAAKAEGDLKTQLDYRTSLVLRSDRTVIDSSVPYAMRVEQIYRPAIDLGTNLTTKVRIRKRVPPARPGSNGPPPPAPRELGTFDGLSRDLRETPYAIELDLAAIEDGAQVIEAEVFDGAASLGAAALNVFLHKGLDAKLKALDAAAATVTPAVCADVMFPADYIKNVNRGRIELADFNVGAEIARAEAVLAGARGEPQKSPGPQKAQTVRSTDPFAGTGAPALTDSMKAIPQFVVHGDADNTVNVSGSRNMVAALRKLNANVTYIEVPGGSHTDVVVPNLPQAFEFLAAQRKGVQGSR